MNNSNKKIYPKLVVVLLFVFFTATSFAQNYNITDGGNTTSCAGTFYDQGGTSDYSAVAAPITHTFCSDDGNPIQFDFTTFQTENNKDKLQIYDGADATAALLGTFSGNTSPGVITSTGTCITFVWDTDNDGGLPGWAASISCVAPPAGTGDNCAGAVVLTPGTQQCGINTSAGDFNDDGTAPTNPCYGSYNDGEYWFEYTANGDGLQLDVSGLTGTYSGLFVLDDCPAGTPNCIASYMSGSLSVDFSVTTPALTNGQTYYIVLANWYTPYSTDFCLDATELVIVPTCNDGIQNQGETGIDCGGPCPECSLGVDCSTSNVIGGLPYSLSATTCGSGDDYSSADACGSVYMDGEDYVFEYTPGVDELINIDFTNTDTYTGFFVLDGCPDAGGTNCVAQATASGGNQSLCNIALTAGQTYYIVVSTYPSPDCTVFDIDISLSSPIINTINTCSGNFYDSGGAGGDYSPCESTITTYCPDNPGQVIQVDFTSWSVEGATNDDQLIVYDGDNISAPQLYFADGLNSGIISVQASHSNASGCLTFEWKSDDDATVGAGWEAAISCTYPCQLVQIGFDGSTPVDNTGYIDVCQGDNVAFNVHGVYPENNNAYTQSDATSTYTWVFGDGTQQSGVGLTSVNHTYTDEGGYNVDLIIEDVEGCTNIDALDKRIRVSMTPSFVGTNTDDNSLCLGQCVNLTGVVTPVAFEIATGQVLADTTFLPDGSGVTYSTSLDFTNFTPGQTVGSASDIIDICMEIEHSYLGDLDAVIECPNGTQITLFDGDILTNSTSAGAYFGEPLGGTSHNLDDNTPLTDPTINLPGTPWSYCFDMGSSQMITASGTAFDFSLSAGSYLSEDNFELLTGCPLNGTWTIHITDDIGSDNGWIYSWGINLNPLIYPPLWSFTNTSVSEVWSGNGVGAGNPTTACPTTLGNQDYIFTYTDDFGCSYDTTVSINVTGVTVTTDFTNPTCAGYTDGTASVTNATGGTAPYTYSWDDAGTQTTATATGLPAGTYNVTVTDNNGCEGYGTVTLTEPAGMTLTMYAVAAICGLNNGTATATITASNPKYDYEWSNNNDTFASSSLINAISGLASGTYTVIVTDDNGCTITDNVTVDPSTAVVSTPTYDGNDCLTGNSYNFTNNGTHGINYTWTFPGGAVPATSNAENPTNVSWAAAGTYIVTLIVDDGAGCTDTQTINVTVYSEPTVTLTPTDPLCNGDNSGQIVAAISGGTVGFNYDWSPNGFTGDGTNTYSGLSGGSYTLDISDANSCTGTSTVSLTELSALTASIVPTDVDCNGASTGSADLTVGGGTAGYTYAWSSGQTSEDLTNILAGGYTVTVTDVAGCTIIATTTINEPTALTASATATDAGCNGVTDGSVTVTPSGGTPGYTYAWSSGGSGVTENGLGAGTYTVTVTDSQGCTVITTTTVNEPTPVTVTIASTTDASCNGATDGDATVTPGGGIPGYTYIWSSGGSGATETGLGVGGYTVTVTDSQGCTASTTAIINEPAVLTASITGTDVGCNGTSTGAADLTVGGGTTAYGFNWSNGATSEDLTNIAVGSYTVTVSDAQGCTETASVAINEAPALTASIVPTDADCDGASTGGADLTVGGGTPVYGYAWSSGPTTEGLINIPAGGYTVTVTDVAGCTITATTTINEPTALTASTTATDAGCNGATDGNATVTPGDGTPGYIYAWSSGGNAALETGLGDGTYTVTVTDAAGCAITTTATVTEPTPVTATIASTTDASCNGATDGSATVTPGGGTPGYTYAWSSGGNASLETGLGAVTYTVTVTDVNGCTQTTTATITEPVVLTAGIVGTDVGCNGVSTGAVDLTVGGGTTPYGFNWSNGATSEDLTNIVADVYTVTVTDAQGCTETASVTINEAPALTASIVAADADCNGASTGVADLTVGGGTAGYTYAWSSGPTTEDLTNIPAGGYTVTVTDAAGCTITATTTINEPIALTASATATDAGCNGATDGSATVTPGGGTPGYTYAWSSGGNAALETGLGDGTYTVTVTDAAGCTITTTATVTEPTPVTATITSTTDASCNGTTDGSATVTAGGGTTPYTYAWPSTGSGITESGLAAGSYIVTVTDANGCTQTATAVIAEPTVLTASASGNDADCNGVCNGDAIVTPSGGTAPYTYAWDDGAFQTTATATALCVNTYNVTVTDAQGCTATASQVINEPAAMTLTMSSNYASCGGSDGDASVAVAGGTPGYTYLWSSGGTGLNETGLSSASYTVTVTDANGCTAENTVSVNDGGAPVASITGSTNVSCNGVCDGTADVGAVGGTLPYTYAWSSGGSTANETGICAGTVSVTVTDALGCASTDNVFITEPIALTAAITSTTDVSCNGGNDGEAIVTANGGTPVYTYAWPSTGSSDTETGLTAGSHIVTVTDANGCIITAAAVINGPTLLTATITSITDVSCNGGTDGTATVTVADGTSGYTYAWPSGGSSDTETNLGDGSYIVTVTDANGCTVTATATITEPTVLTAAITSTTNVSCNAGNDGELVVTAADGTPGYTYAWPSGGSADTETGLIAGSYIVTVTDALGCTVTATGTITEPTVLTAAITSTTDVSCNAGNDGELVVIVSDGTPTYSYAWPSGGSSDTETGLIAGSYIVTVTDALGCTVTATATITEPIVLTATITSTTDVSCAVGNDGEATVIPAGGTPGYTYAWPSGGTSATETGLSVESYIVTVTDVNGCTVTATATITEPLALTASIKPTDALCNGACDGEADLLVGDGTPPYLYSWSNGATTEDLTGLCAGGYDVTITDALGCTIIASTTINEPVTLAAIITSSTNVFVFGSSDGSATVAATDGTPGYSYDWSPDGFTGDGTDTYSDLPSGNYDVIITDVNGCTATASVTINEPGAIILSTTQVDLLCNGDCDGQATVTVDEGGVPPFIYAWPSGGTATIETGLCVGGVTVTVTDDNGAFQTATVTIIEPTLLTATITSTTDVSCVGGDDGSATVVPADGTPGYTYLWPSGGTSVIESGLATESYIVTITDANGCIVTATAIINEPILLAASITATTDLSCNGGNDGSATVTATDGTPSYTYAWPSGGTSATESGLSVGSYIVTATDANGCTTTATAIINEPTVITLTTSAVDAHCSQSDGEVSVVASGGNSGYGYGWFNNAGLTNSIGQNTDVATGLPTGTYYVLVTDVLGCTETASVTITDLPGPTDAAIVVDNNTSALGVCDGQATASMTGAVSYEWYDDNSYANPIGQSSATATGLCSGEYCVIATDASGCTDIACVTITSPGQLILDYVASTLGCFGDCDGTIDVTVAGGLAPYVYVWSDGSTDEDRTGLCAGDYTVTVTDNNGAGISASETITIVNPIQVTASIIEQHDVLCNNGNTGWAVAEGQGGTGVYTYQWDGGLNPLNDTVTDLSATTYSVTVEDENNCQAFTSVTINEPNQIVLNISGTDENCGQINGTVTVVATGGLLPYTYEWDATANNQTTLTATNLSDGTYSVIVTDALGCTQTASITLVNIPSGVVTLESSTDVSCNGECDGEATIGIVGGVPPYIYEWSTTPVQLTQTAGSLCAGVYFVTIIDADNCDAKLNIVINGPTELTNTLTVTNITCSGDCNGEITANPVGGTAPYTYQWSGTIATTQTVSNLCVGNYTVTVTDFNGCQVITDAIIIDGITMDITEVISNASCGQSDGAIDITVTGGDGVYTYEWNNDPLLNTEDLDTVQAGTYTVVVTDGGGCTATVTFNVVDQEGPTANITSFTNVSCFGDCNGIATVETTGGLLPYTYEWDDTTPAITNTNLCPGVHSVIVTDHNGCDAVANVTIIEPLLLEITTSSTQSSCNGDANGASTVDVVGGTTPYSYEWTGGGTSTDSVTNTGLEDGVYNIIVTDTNGCIAISNVTVTEPPFLTLFTTGTDPLCSYSCNGSITSNVGGGILPYSYEWSDGQTVQNASNLCEGLYYLTITDGNGCTIETTEELIAPDTLIAEINTLGNVRCNGGNDGFASANATGGTPGYTYAWSNGENTQSITYLIANTYTVTVTDANGCIAIEQIIISEPQPLNLTILPVDESCYGECDGSISSIVSGGTTPYSYMWSTAETTDVINTLCQGNYILDITDSLGCTNQDDADVSGPTLLDATATTISAHCDQPDGSAMVSVIGGVYPYEYSWVDFPDVDGNSINNVTADSYIIIVTDDNGCETVHSVNIQNLDGPVIESVSVVNVSCNGLSNGSASVVASGGTVSGDYVYEWNTIPGTSSQTGLSEGTVYLVVTDDAGCPAYEDIYIDEPDQLVAAINSTYDVGCYGGSDGEATVIVVGGTPNYTIEWSNGDTGNTADELSIGTWVATVTDANNCTTDMSVEIDQPEQIVITGVTTDIECYGESNGVIEVFVEGGTGTMEYEWNPDVTNTSVDADLSVGNHCVTATDDNGCQETACFVIYSPTEIIPDFVVTPTTCGNDNGTALVTVIGGTPDYSYLWASNQNATDYSENLPTGDHPVIIVDDNGCILQTSIFIPSVIPPALDYFIPHDVLCYGTSDGVAEIYMKQGTEPYTFTWPAPITETGGTVNSLPAGIYNVTMTDADGCAVVIPPIVIGEPDPLTVYADGATTICIGQEATITANAGGGTPDYKYQWDNGELSNIQNFVVSPIEITCFNVVAFDENNCQSEPAQVCVDVHPPIDVEIIDPETLIICEGDMIILNPLATGGNGGPYVYNWDNVDFTPDITTTYTVTAEDGCGSPSDQATITIDVEYAPDINLAIVGNKDCEPITVDFDNLISNNDEVTYSWDFGDYNSEYNTSSDTSTSHSYEDAGIYSVGLTVTTINAGCVASEVFDDLIEVYPVPEAAFYAFPMVTDIYHANIEFFDQSIILTNFSEITSWTWKFDDNTTSDEKNPEHLFTETGEYNVTLEIESEHHCKDTVVDKIIVKNIHTFYAPNAITPDLNGVNSYFQVQGKGIDMDSYRIIVYDRWGEVIFTSDDFYNYWNGRHNNTSEKFVEMGVYTWLINFKDIYGQEHERTGTVTVLR